MRCNEAGLPENPLQFEKFVKSLYEKQGGNDSRKVDLSCCFFSSKTLSKVIDCFDFSKVAHLNLS